MTPSLAARSVMLQMSICCVILAKPTLMDMAVLWMTLWLPPSLALALPTCHVSALEGSQEIVHWEAPMVVGEVLKDSYPEWPS